MAISKAKNIIVVAYLMLGSVVITISGTEDSTAVEPVIEKASLCPEQDRKVPS